MINNIKTHIQAATYYINNKDTKRVYCSKCRSRKLLKYCDPTLFIATLGRETQCIECSPDLLGQPISHVKNMRGEASYYYHLNKDTVRKYCAIKECANDKFSNLRGKRLLKFMNEDLYAKTRGDVTICESCMKEYKIINIPSQIQASLLKNPNMVCKNCGEEKPFYEFPSTDSKSLIAQGFATKTGLVHYCKDCIDSYNFKYDIYKGLYKTCSNCGAQKRISEYIETIDKVDRVIKKKVLNEDGVLELVPIKDYEGTVPDFIYVADIACPVCKNIR